MNVSSKGLVSVIMPAYNTGQYISASIRSVISQSYNNWELIIVDDCSTDDTCEKISGFQDQRIKYYRNSTHSGAALSRNYALRKAKGKWVAFLDSDDLWVPEKLERQLNFMIENNYAFTFTDYRVCWHGKWESYIHTGPLIITKKILYEYGYFFTSTVIYDRRKIGLIQIQNLKRRNDYAMWFHVVDKFLCYRMPECLSFYIKHEGSVSSVSKWELTKWYYKMYRLELKKGRVLAALCTMNNLAHGPVKKLYYREKVADYKGYKVDLNSEVE